MKKNTLAKNDIKDSCGLTSKFWDDFAKSKWEKETFVEKNSFVTPPISEAELFECLVGMCLEQIDDEDDGGDRIIRMYVDNKELSPDYNHLFPTLNDKNFSGYRQRVTKELNGKPFAFVVDTISMPLNLKIWTNDFLKGMYQPLKFISKNHFWSIFFGNYTTTPYGVHDHSTLISAESAFYFPIVGEKEMTVWSPNYLDQHPELKHNHDYTAHIDASTNLLAEPGGMMYWPSDRWHIGSSGGDGVSIVLGVIAFYDVYIAFFEAVMSLDAISPYYREPGILSRTCERIEGFMLMKHMALLKYSARARHKQIRELPFDSNDLQGSAELIPDDLRKIARRMNVKLYFGKNLEKVLSIFWLFQLTNIGAVSCTVPSPAIMLEPELRIKKNDGVNFLWRHVDTQIIMLAADEYAHEIPTLFLPMIEYLAEKKSGQEVSYSDLLLSISGNTIPQQTLEKELSELLSFLGQSGAFQDLTSN